MKLTTTLNKIRASSPCTSGWKKLLSHLGTDFNPDAEINLLTVLESNGVADMLWTLRATEQDSKRIASQLVIEFAEQLLPIFENRHPEDQCPRRAIQAARDYLDGKIDLGALRKARAAAATYATTAIDAANAAVDAANAVAANAAVDAANSAAIAAANAAATYVAANVANSAAIASAAANVANSAAIATTTYATANTAAPAQCGDWNAAREKAREKQADIIRMILEA